MGRQHKPGTYILVHSKYKLQEIDAVGQSIFMWLCDHANQEGTCFPSISRLSKLCKKSKNTVKDRLKKLEKLGLIKKYIRKTDFGENKSNLYQIIENDWVPETKSRSKNDQPLSTTAGLVSHPWATNQNKKEQKPNNPTHTSSVSYLNQIPEEDMIKFMIEYDISKEFVEKKASDVIAYCDEKNKVYKNYRSALKGFIERDLQRRGIQLHQKRRLIGSMKQIGDLLSERNRGP